jgi:NTE family protein
VRLAYRIAQRRLYLFNSDFLQRLVTEHAVVDDFAATLIPLHVTATDMHSGEKHVFSTGKVSTAVLASTALPGVFAPVEIGGRTYLDGGVVANLDLKSAVGLGARDILAIDLTRCIELPEPTTAIGVITRTVDIVMQDRAERDLADLDGKARIALVQPQIDAALSIGDLSQVSRLIDQGERFAEQIIDGLFDARGRLRPGTYRAPVLAGEPQEGAGAKPARRLPFRRWHPAQPLDASAEP